MKTWSIWFVPAYHHGVITPPPAVIRLHQFCAALIGCHLVAGSCAGPRTFDTTHTPDAEVGTAHAGEVTTPNGDQTCLQSLESSGVAFKGAAPAGGMRTPVEIVGPIGKVGLVARGRRGAVMDCVLARALVQASAVFDALGITALMFSAAYDNRTQRGSSEPSAHAYGLAIDVHAVRGPLGEYDVRKHFERGLGKWIGLNRGKDPDALAACVGQPAANEGRLLRQLACRLKLHPAFRVIVSPDDNSDHADHLHIEAGSSFFPPPADAPPLSPPPAQSRPVRIAPGASHPSASHATGKAERATKRKSTPKKKHKAAPKSNPKPKRSPVFVKPRPSDAPSWET